MFSVKSGTVILASPFLIGAVYVFPFAITETSPVAFSKPVTLTVAFSPAFIGSAFAFIVKFFLLGSGAGLTVMSTVVDALL